MCEPLAPETSDAPQLSTQLLLLHQHEDFVHPKVTRQSIVAGEMA